MHHDKRHLWTSGQAALAERWTHIRNRWGRPLRVLMGATFLLVVSGFLGRVLITHWAELQGYRWTFHPPLVIVSLCALAASYLTDIYIWRHAVQCMGGHLAYWRAVRLWYAASITKYIPGTIWQFMGWFVLAEQEGVPRLIALSSILVTQAVSALAGLILGLAAFAGIGHTDVVDRLLPLLATLPIALVVVHPRVVEGGVNLGLRFLGKRPIHLALGFADLVRIFLLYLGSYAFWGVALFLFTNSLTPVDLTHLPTFLGIFPVAYILGLIAPWAPAGLGVREGVLTYLLSFYMPIPVATVVALLARPWMMVLEVPVGVASLSFYVRAGLRPPVAQNANET